MVSNQASDKSTVKSTVSNGNSQPAGPKKSEVKRGFAAMDEARQREIASRGGQAAHRQGTAHEFNSGEARRAGQKGGETVSRDRAHMAEIGRKGGESRQSAQRASATAGSGQQAKTSRQGGKDDDQD